MVGRVNGKSMGSGHLGAPPGSTVGADSANVGMDAMTSCGDMHMRMRWAGWVSASATTLGKSPSIPRPHLTGLMNQGDASREADRKRRLIYYFQIWSVGTPCASHPRAPSMPRIFMPAQTLRIRRWSLGKLPDLGNPHGKVHRAGAKVVLDFAFLEHTADEVL